MLRKPPHIQMSIRIQAGDLLLGLPGSGEAGTGCSVIVGDERLHTGDPPLDAERWGTLALTALMDENALPSGSAPPHAGRAPAGAEAPSSTLGLLFVDPKEMARLNMEHRGKDRPTDVLAFPIDGRPSDPQTGPVLVGDVVVCPAYAVANIADYADHPAVSSRSAPPPFADSQEEPGLSYSFEDVLALLVVHGVLHVLGYDHIKLADAAVMQARERDLLSRHHRS